MRAFRLSCLFLSSLGRREVACCISVLELLQIKGRDEPGIMWNSSRQQIQCTWERGLFCLGSLQFDPFHSQFLSPGISLKEELTLPILILGTFTSPFFFPTSTAFLFHGCHLHPKFFPLWDSVWKLGVFPAPWAAELWGV